MSKRIDTTLTDAQWDEVVIAIDKHMIELTDEDDNVRQLVLNRAFFKLRDGLR